MAGYFSILRDQFNRLTVTSTLTSFLTRCLGIPTLLYLIEPFLNIMATAAGALTGLLWSILLWPLRAIGYPAYGITKLAFMPIAAFFEPVIKGLGATAISIEQCSVAIQELFLSPVLPAVSIRGVVRQLLYGESLSALLYCISLPAELLRACVAMPLWPLKAVATFVQIVAIGAMVPIRLSLIPVLMCLNMLILPFDMLGYLGSGTVLYMLYMCIPPEIITMFTDLSTLPSRLSSLVDTVLWRILVFPFHYISELLKSLGIGMPEPIASGEELTGALTDMLTGTGLTGITEAVKRTQ